MTDSDVLSILQASVAPFVLISGIGLVLLSMTNRIARPTDLVRRVLADLKEADPGDRPWLLRELAVLLRRCRILRGAIACAVAAIACAGALVLALFAALITGTPLELLVSGLFAACLLALLASLVLFFWDIRLTLHSLHIEVEWRTRGLTD
ncbi:MAG: DUF2721 domain-containing protein [Desulfovibrionaceae bacterium]